MKKMMLFAVIIWAFLSGSLAALTEVPDTKTIPSALEGWEPWVLHGKEAHFCPVSLRQVKQRPGGHSEA